MKNAISFKYVLVGLLLVAGREAWAQPPAADTTGGIIRQQIDQEKLKRLEKEIRSEKKQAQEEKPTLPEAEKAGPKVLINKIQVEGATLVPAAEIDEITARYQGQELTLDDMQTIADEITALYRQKGYVTSRAYLPPQNIKAGLLIIRVVEGKLGQVDVRGNRHFSTKLLKREMDLAPEGYFDYSALQKSLAYVNEHPDRLAKVLLVPGATPGTTDIVVDVQDRLPLHVAFGYDNYATDYLGKLRYAMTLEHNNLTGHDDRLLFKLQYSDGMLLDMQMGRYLFPLSQKLEVGGYFLLSRTELKEEFEGLDSEGKAQLYGLFATQELARNEDLEINLNVGFDYKDVKDYFLNERISHDELSVAKIGLDFDVADRFGRTIFTPQIDLGIPEFLGSMEAKDPNASRAGAGGQFQKYLCNFFRLQPLPWDMSLLWKNSAQYSNHSLAAVEQFQIGGPTSVRAYSPAEYYGDKGYYTALEWSIPPYGLPKSIKFPTRNIPLYDTWRFVAFYDFGFVDLRRPEAGEQENQTLKGYGFGTRFNVSNDIAMRVEVGFPTGPDSIDGRDHHLWYELNWKF
jgi:hemolysin activation/secretion protein